MKIELITNETRYIKKVNLIELLINWKTISLKVIEEWDFMSSELEIEINDDSFDILTQEEIDRIEERINDWDYLID